MSSTQRFDHLLALAALALIIVGCYLVLRPFLSGLLWAIILTITLWPLYGYLTTRMGPTLAALVMVVLITLVLVAPFAIVFAEIADNSARVATWIRGLLEAGPPEPPAWVAGLPVIGERAAAYWESLANDTAKFLGELRRFIDPIQRVLFSSGATILGGLLQLALSILIAFFLFRDGYAIRRRLEIAAERLAAGRGRRLALTVAQTVRGVVIGILGTAIAQGVLAGIGFWMAGIGPAPLLGFVTFLLSPIPVGPPLVWVPVGLVLLHEGQIGWGVFVLLWGLLVVSSIDNFIKPLIISHGSDLPFLLVLLGILGGVIAFGFIGVFLGPVLLALGYALVKEWSAEHSDAPPAL